jgi:hypothetical protein
VCLQSKVHRLQICRMRKRHCPTTLKETHPRAPGNGVQRSVQVEIGDGPFAGIEQLIDGVSTDQE